MKPIKLTQPQIKAIQDGGTKLVFPIKETLVKPIDSKYPENEMYLDAYNKTDKWYWWTQDGRQNLNQCIVCPIQSNQEYYVVEDFVKLNDTRIVNGNPAKLIYEDDFLTKYDNKVEIKNIMPQTKGYYNESELIWTEADQMQPHQSRIPKIVFESIEVKRVEELSTDERFSLLSREYQQMGFWNENDWNNFLNDQSITSEYVFIADIKEVEIK